MASLASPARAIPRRRCLRLSGIDWRTYSRLLHAFAEQPGVRLAYDRGELEVMSPLLLHDNPAWLLGLMVIALCQELNLPVKCGGSTTLRRRLKRKGIEADACFWIANAHQIIGVDRLDLRRHPPPDLAIEVDVTRSSLNRMKIYAALRVPEIWRLQNQALAFHVLQADGAYAVMPRSLAFPIVGPADLLGFLQLARQSAAEGAVIDQFRAWVRQRLTAAP